MDEFLTVAEVAGILKLNPQTIRNWIDAGTLPAVRIGRRVRIRREDFQALLNQDRHAAAPTRHAELDRASKDAQAFWEGDYLPLPAPLR